MRHLRIAAPLVALAALLIAAPAQARTDNRSKPVIFVHGLDAFGTAGVNCAGSFGNMKTTLANRGFTGPLRTVKYYQGDSNCDTSLDDNGSHSTHYASGHGGGSHNADADIRHLSYHLAWMIWTDYTRNGVRVDLVGHSMGGLISRYMVHRIQANDPAFPSYLYVEDVVTLGTPAPRVGMGVGLLVVDAVQPDGERLVVHQLPEVERLQPAGRRRHRLAGPTTTGSSPRDRRSGWAPRTRSTTSAR